MWGGKSQAGLRRIKGATEQLLTLHAQPRPYAAIDLIHQQPVRWTHERIVSCDGGGGPLGHPRIFINTDKPQICWCTYCGLPFVRHSRLEAKPGEQNRTRTRLTQARPTSTTAHTLSLCPQTSSHTHSDPRATPLRSTRHRRSQMSLLRNGRLEKQRKREFVYVNMC